MNFGIAIVKVIMITIIIIANKIDKGLLKLFNFYIIPAFLCSELFIKYSFAIIYYWNLLP